MIIICGRLSRGKRGGAPDVHPVNLMYFDSIMNFWRNLAGKGLALAGVLSAAATAHAHPGHDLLEHGPKHALTSVDHLLVMAVCGLLLITFGMIAQKRTARRAMIGTGTIAITAAAVLWMVS